MEKGNKKILVVNPENGRIHNVAPLLDAIDFYLEGSENAANTLADIIEDFAIYAVELMEHDGQKLSEYLYFLSILRHAMIDSGDK